MPNYLSPGVYVEEVEAGSRPIEGVGTAVAAFVGLAEKGPMQRADAGLELDPVRRDLRRLHAGHLPGPRRLRLHAERRQQLLHRSRRRRTGAPMGTSPRPTARSRPARRSSGRGRPRPRRPGRLHSHRGRPAAAKTISLDVSDGDGDRPARGPFTLAVSIDGKPAETYDNVSTKEGDAYVVDQGQPVQARPIRGDHARRRPGQARAGRR